jgi:hypothetical protein
MTTSRQKIELGKPFTVAVPNSREKEFEVLNLQSHNFDRLICKILNSTSYAPPGAYVTDSTNNIIRIRFEDSRLNLNTPLEMIVQGAVDRKVEVVEKKVLFDSQKTVESMKSAANGTVRALKIAFWSFIALSILFYFIKSSAFGDFIIDVWSRFNAAQVIRMTEELDPRIMTNKHHVYETAAFGEFDILYKRNFGSGKKLKKLYRFAGNDFFVTQDLIKNRDGSFMLVTKSDAEDFCEMIAGRLLSMEELKAYLAGQYLTIENFIWPVSLRAEIPEWSGAKHRWDNYWLYLKDVSPDDVKEVDPDAKMTSDKKFVSADDGDVKAAFRCGFDGTIFLQAM